MVTSCSECGKYEVCMSQMPYHHMDGIWHTPQEKRKWMRKHVKDCYLDKSFWEAVTEKQKARVEADKVSD